MIVKPYLDQDYQKIKVECLRSGKLFEDDEFPADASSIYNLCNFLESNILWKRPSEIFQNPKFIINQFEPYNLEEGNNEKCWVIESLQFISHVSDHLERIIPDDQTFNKDNYTGLFHFHFWLNGEWVDVVIDDRLPVDKNNNLIFCRNFVNENEMCGALLEKAFAKLNVCYEFLRDFNLEEALVFFVGGFNEKVMLKTCLPTASIMDFFDPNELWEFLFKSIYLKSLISCKTYSDSADLGLIPDNRYMILDVFEIYLNNDKYGTLRKEVKTNLKDKIKSIRLLKIKSLTKSDSVFRGKWSFGSRDWDKISESVKKDLSLKDSTKSHFFIEFEDFLKYFEETEAFHCDLTGIMFRENKNYKEKWKVLQVSGEWVSNQTLASYDDNDENFWKNPKYRFNLPKHKDENGTLNVYISLLQTETSKRRLEKFDVNECPFEAIGFNIYSIKKNAEKINNDYKKSELESCFHLDTFPHVKQITKRLKLDFGDYLIVPFMLGKNDNMKFLLRIHVDYSDFIFEPNFHIQNVNSVKNDNFTNSDFEHFTNSQVSSISCTIS